MDFRNLAFKPILLILLPVGLILGPGEPWAEKSDPSAHLSNPQSGENMEDTAIQEQLGLDRKQQRITKDLKIKLEQTNLELEEEKAQAQIAKLQKENTGAFSEPSLEATSNLPQVAVDYIGGDKGREEAIISINGTDYQVRNNSYPTDNIRVVSISDSSITLHFKPQNLTKNFDFKPE
ncbi:MAG: hypothetical protein KGJ09_03650 [Candidatus Omnitrophica bacterium]|nr:hypothetical protein [Candidatus Omnitrophota bacterium]MDE2009154.1 hypothetical protein [Candidatus Omnitrophota bacterium]MDE2213675.1 hypothetical protein [Candidatus Omnitrophota bacterium]MDE2230750.1 hypothetical protein [Candidatus Omnitrophota bacterium]